MSPTSSGWGRLTPASSDRRAETLLVLLGFHLCAEKTGLELSQEVRHVRLGQREWTARGIPYMRPPTNRWGASQLPRHGIDEVSLPADGASDWV
jgi:hypothetical protein